MYKDYLQTIYKNTVVTDIFKRIYFSNSFKNSNYVEEYSLQDDDSVESVCYLLYKNSRLSFFIWLLNDIQNIYEDLPLNKNIFNKKINEKYNNSSIVINPDEIINLNFSDVFYVGNQNINYSVIDYNKSFSQFIMEKIPNTIFNNSISLKNKNKDIILTLNSENYNLSYENKFGLHHFKNNTDYYVSPYDFPFENQNTTYLKNYATTNDEQFTETNILFENKINDDKRNILLIKPEKISDIVTEFNRLLIGSPINNVFNFTSPNTNIEQ